MTIFGRGGGNGPNMVTHVLVTLSVIWQMFALSRLCLYLHGTLWRVTHFLLCKGLWVRMARQAYWLAYCKIRLDEIGHPGTSGILHFKYYVLGHTKSFSDVLNSRKVWVLECRDNFLVKEIATSWRWILHFPQCNMIMSFVRPSLHPKLNIFSL